MADLILETACWCKVWVGSKRKPCFRASEINRFIPERSGTAPSAGKSV